MRGSGRTYELVTVSASGSILFAVTRHGNLALTTTDHLQRMQGAVPDPLVIARFSGGSLTMLEEQESSPSESAEFQRVSDRSELPQGCLSDATTAGLMRKNRGRLLGGQTAYSRLPVTAP